MYNNNRSFKEETTIVAVTRDAKQKLNEIIREEQKNQPLKISQKMMLQWLIDERYEHLIKNREKEVD